jgi:flagellar motor protein MotB
VLHASCSFTVSSSGSTGIPAGEEVTISYGSNKTNLALLACYGFFIPANPNDAQLLAPVFNICLAAAGDLQGLPAPLLQQAAELSTQQQHQHEQEAALQGPGVALLHPELVAARRQCALQAIPTLQGPDGVGQQGSVHQQQQPQEAQQGVQSQAGAGKSQQQQQRYLVQLMLYQLDLIFKRCGTSIEQDQGVPQQLQDSADSATGAAGSSSPSLDGAIQQQVLLARLEHKLLLRECCVLLQAALQLLDRA